MGLQSPFGYAGYETAFTKLFIELIENFCGSCHTNETHGGDCRSCPVGQLVYASRQYVLEAYESDILTEESEILRKIKKAIKPIEPSPMMLAQWIWETKRMPDPLMELKEANKDLEFLTHSRLDQFIVCERVTAWNARAMLKLGLLSEGEHKELQRTLTRRIQRVKSMRKRG